MIPIFNAKDRPWGVGKSLPQMNAPILRYCRQLTISILTKTVTNFRVVETPVTKTFQGVMLPYTAQRLKIKPEGQRAWDWNDLFSTTNLELKVDDKVNIDSKTYRVMAKKDYKEAAYYWYEIVEDYV